MILPSSKITIDRATIKSHLLSDRNDPFNRQPMSIDDVVPGESQVYEKDVELKAKIEQWKATRH